MDKTWLEKYIEREYPWMSNDQQYCFRMLCKVVDGAHHIHGAIHPLGRGIAFNCTNNQWGTFDFDALTKLVFLAHDHCVRVEINPCSPKALQITLHKRHTRKGSFMERHPTLDEAVLAHKKRYSQ